MIAPLTALAASACAPAPPSVENAVIGAETEIAAYEDSATRCKGEYVDEAFRTGEEKFNAWRAAISRGIEPPEGAFADAGMAFAHLYEKLGCRDGLVAIRYGNMLRLDRKEAKAIEVLAAAETAVRANYPAHLPYLFAARPGQRAARPRRRRDSLLRTGA